MSDEEEMEKHGWRWVPESGRYEKPHEKGTLVASIPKRELGILFPDHSGFFSLASERELKSGEAERRLVEDSENQE